MDGRGLAMARHEERYRRFMEESWRTQRRHDAFLAAAYCVVLAAAAVVGLAFLAALILGH